MSHTPTPEQQAIIDHIQGKPTVSLMVDARAGAAKSTTIEMASQGINPSLSVLAVAFNKRIAEELQKRVPAFIQCKTLNALGHRAWAARVGKITLDMDKMFKIAKELIPADRIKDEPDLLMDSLTLARKAKGAGLVPTGAPMKVSGLVPDTKDNWMDLGDFAMAYDDSIFFARQIVLKSISDAFKGLIDFDDQIYMSTLFGGTYQKFHTVLVDEAQDLSPLNHLQLKMSVGTRIVAVGDPYQAIYGFRGADSNSMTNLMDNFKGYEKLGLTQSFRVPKKVSARQVDWVPDFGSMPWLEDGSIESWPLTVGQESPTDARRTAWSINEIPRKGFVLCRNNAPLMKLAFALIKAKRPVKILGRDIGNNLATLLGKICDKQDVEVAAAQELVHQWAQKELAKAKDSTSKQDAIFDRQECLEVLLDSSGAKTSDEAIQFIKDLFSDKDAGDLVFSSIHKIKGLEAVWVMHLDPERIPSKQALAAERNGNPNPLVQEMNLKYVCETRTQDVLVMASLSNCQEIESE